MAQFRATIQGNRGEASRLGTKTDGIITDTNAWAGGVRVMACTSHIGEKEESDTFGVYLTGGSDGTGREKRLGSIKIENGEPVWYPVSRGKVKL